ncbi:MAG: glycerophosphodiester phosphodiesterase [Anaerolineales bacterium]
MKKKIALSILGVILLALVLVSAFSRRAPDHPYYSPELPYPLVIAHQGGDGLWPGDTLYAFEHAVELGVDVLEMDLHITKDGVLVINHDETVDRTSDGTGNIEDMNLAEIKKLDAGYDWSNDGGDTFPYRGMGITIPTLEEIFQTFPQYHMTIEIKTTERPMAASFCDMIRAYNMQDKILVASFLDERMEEFRRACPEVATSSARQETTVFVLLSKGFLGRLYSPSFNALQVPEKSGGIIVMTAQFVRAAHERNLRVEPWTIDDPEQMKMYIAWGVDGVMTDRPDLMLEILGR